MRGRGVPADLRGVPRVGAYAAAGSVFGPLWWWNNAPCATWPKAPDRYAGPWTARTSAPVLVVGNYFDGVTGYDGAVASSKLLGNSRLLSYAGWGHTAFGRSGCTTDYITAYLLDGSLPPAGTVCPANPNPFVPRGFGLRTFGRQRQRRARATHGGSPTAQAQGADALDSAVHEASGLATT